MFGAFVEVEEVGTEGRRKKSDGRDEGGGGLAANCRGGGIGGGVGLGVVRAVLATGGVHTEL